MKALTILERAGWILITSIAIGCMLELSRVTFNVFK
jgi:hypothetical protein